MTIRRFRYLLFFLLSSFFIFVSLPSKASDPQSKKGMGKGKGGASALKADQSVFHYLLENHQQIRRTVTRLENGVETITVSDNPEVTKKIQDHVLAMHNRIKEGRGFRFWDDLFAAIFKNHAKIAMTIEKTEKGVRVKETSDDPFTIALIQAHAEIVSKFVESGFEEAHKNHSIPKSNTVSPKLIFPIIRDYGGVVPLSQAAEQPRKGAKVVMNITAKSEDDEVNPGLQRAARLLNLYGSAKLTAKDIKLTLILHGEATEVILNSPTYQKHTQIKQNPNLKLLLELKRSGVEIYVCGQSLHSKGFNESEVSEDTQVALSALNLLINRQTDGYVVVSVP